MNATRDFIESFYKASGDRTEANSSVASLLDLQLKTQLQTDELDPDSIREEILGRGPICQYLKDPSVTEIIVDGHQSLFI